MLRNKAKTYAQVMMEAFDGLSEEAARKKARTLKAVLLKHGDSKYVGKILQEFSQFWKTRKGPVATVVSSERLSEGARKEMRRALTKRTYAMEENVDASVIGGIALYLGNDYVIDGTIREKLRRIARVLER